MSRNATIGTSNAACDATCRASRMERRRSRSSSRAGTSRSAGTSCCTIEPAGGSPVPSRKSRMWTSSSCHTTWARNERRHPTPNSPLGDELETRVDHLDAAALLPQYPFDDHLRTQPEPADRAAPHEPDHDLARAVGHHRFERLVVLHREHGEPSDHAGDLDPLPQRRVGDADGAGNRVRPFADLGFQARLDRKSTRLNSSHMSISYAVFCLTKKKRPHLSGTRGCYRTKTKPRA